MNINRATTRRTTAQRTATKRATANRTTTGGTPANRAATKRARTRRTTATRATAKRTTAARTTAKRVTGRRATTSRATAKRTTATSTITRSTTARPGITSPRTRPASPAGLRLVRAGSAPALLGAQKLLASLRPVIRGAGPAAREAKRHAERIEFSVRRLAELTEMAVKDGGAFTPARAEVAGSILQVHLDAAARFLGISARTSRRRAA